MKRILGIDTGTNSLGWAVVDNNSDGTYTLVRKGSLIFQEGVKIEKGIESSKAAERTTHRSMRKQYFRRRLRKIEVLKVLVKYGLCPTLSDEQLHEWHVHKVYPYSEAFLNWQRTNENESKNPYYYRHLCLHDKLDMNSQHDRYILGRSLYHLAQRRGFLSNRLDGNEDTNDAGTVKEGISDLTKEMEFLGCKYLGDYFYMLYNKSTPQRIRNHYTDRETHYKAEFYAICECQQLPIEMIRELERALYFQRALKSQRKGVGKCTMEKGKPRCAESHPEYEEFRLWSFINNIKVKGPYDLELRNLNKEEIDKVLPLFFRKSKPNFDFEDIAKSIAGKNNYQNIKEVGDKPYKFNYRMSQSVAGCPTISHLKSIFGADWKSGIAESYILNTKNDGCMKSEEDMVNDVWNILYSFSSQDKLKEYAVNKLQLEADKADEFSKIKPVKGFANLSLCAIRKILPFLKSGIIYSHAVSLANIPTIIGKETWERDKAELMPELIDFISNFSPSDDGMQGTLDFCIKDLLKNRYDLKPGATDKLYHPSMIETYPDAKIKDGVYQLGSPRTNAIRNPMAMRSLHQLRKVVNMLLKEKVIDNKTEVHVEYARELNDANMRKAIASYNKVREQKRAEFASQIVDLYKKEKGKDITPNNEDILRFQLWEEQNHICLYTGKQIGISQIVGRNPEYDIEHTIPRSVGGDFTQMNLTLCNNRYNREVKQARIPSQMQNYTDILERVQPWKEHIESLTKDIDKLRRQSRACSTKAQKDSCIQKRHIKELERDYWKGKYLRFTMTEVPEGFARRQGAGIGLVSKYARLYLKSLFHDPNNRQHSNVFVVKGATTAEFRKMWGIQNEYEKKSRDSHAHHCIDAITIACIGPNEYNQMARYYHQYEEYQQGLVEKPHFPKPWATFSEDMHKIEKELLVVHSVPDNMPKHTKKYIRTKHGKFLATGDSARGSLHMDTYYGAIERDGEIRYVQRIELSKLKESNVKDIVDDVVRGKIEAEIERKGFKEAISGDIYMREPDIKIRKVRCYVSNTKLLQIRNHRDVSKKEYKRQFNVAVDGNYCMAIYEGVDKKGNTKRTYEIVNTYEAAKYFKTSANKMLNKEIVPTVKNGLQYRGMVKTGTHIILLEDDKEKIDVNDTRSISDRLYNVAIMQKDGRIILRHSQEARPATELKKETRAGAYKKTDSYRSQISMSLSDFHALIEGYDFNIDIIGNVNLV